MHLVDRHRKTETLLPRLTLRVTRLVHFCEFGTSEDSGVSDARLALGSSLRKCPLFASSAPGDAFQGPRVSGHQLDDVEHTVLKDKPTGAAVAKIPLRQSVQQT